MAYVTFFVQKPSFTNFLFPLTKIKEKPVIQ